jgi:protein-S-isoprenylcysteine O-methyltransferase Ste14
MRDVGLLKRVARLRVPLGFVSGIAALWLAQPSARTLAYGTIVAAAGEAMRVWAAGHLEKGREVTTSGPYAFTRHPLYVGSSVIGVGLVVAASSVWVGALVLVYLAVTLTAAIRTEEAHLTQKFGDAYPEYREGRVAGAERRFSPARAMRNREYRAVAGLAIVLGVLAWKVWR